MEKDYESETQTGSLYKRAATELVHVKMIAWPRQLLVRATQLMIHATSSGGQSSVAKRKIDIKGATLTIFSLEEHLRRKANQERISTPHVPP